jgi:type I restriction enzyme S subunit
VDKKTREDENPILLCNYTDVYYNEYITESIDFMQASANDSQIRKFKLEAGDTIITKDSETPKDIAVPAYVPFNLPNVICGYHLAQIKPNEELVLGEFIFRCFQSMTISDQYSSRANGITRFGLTVNAIGEGIFPLPPIEEQLSIVQYIKSETSRLDQLITKKQRLIELFQEKRQALITQAVTQGLDLTVPMKDSSLEWYGEMPENWELVKLKRLFRIANGSTPKSTITEYWDGEILWATPNDLGKIEAKYIENTERKISELGYTNSGTTLVPAGSIILSTRAPIGHIAIAGKEMCTNQGCKSLRIIKEDTTDSEYYYYLLFSLKSILQSLGQGTTFLELSNSNLGSIYLPFFDRSEQVRIATFLNRETSKHDQLHSKLTNQIRQIEEYRQTLITNAVTGKIDVRGEGN